MQKEGKKDPEETVPAFWTMIKKNQPQKKWVDKCMELDGQSKKNEKLKDC